MQGGGLSTGNLPCLVLEDQSLLQYLTLAGISQACLGTLYPKRRNLAPEQFITRLNGGRKPVFPIDRPNALTQPLKLPFLPCSHLQSAHRDFSLSLYSILM